MSAGFRATISSVDESFTRRAVLKTVQVNTGNRCNQRCAHCHINAGPEGREVMPREVMDDVARFLSRAEKQLRLDITGGCPELNPDFRYLIEKAGEYAGEVTVRNNLTVFFEDGMQDLPEFYRRNKIKLICSLPCYTRENVDGQRGSGVFDKSIKALRLLNSMGYGKGEGLHLDLVYNPAGAFLPADQAELEKEYKRILRERYGIVFDRLFTLTNVAINRFRQRLETEGVFDKYIKLLIDSFNKDVAGGIMCRNLLSVKWDGTIYDCDFNLTLGLAMRDENGRAMKIGEIEPGDLAGKEITFEEHCYSCTAGAGSSCDGVLNK